MSIIFIHIHARRSVNALIIARISDISSSTGTDGMISYVLQVAVVSSVFQAVLPSL